MKNIKIKTNISLSMLIVTLVTIISCTLGLVSASKMKQPVPINSEEEFYEKINKDLNGYFTLNDSIVFSQSIKPIGDKDHHFTGMFDGGNHVLSNLTFDANNYKESCSIDNNVFVGLFPFFDGVIINTRFTNVKFSNFNLANDEIVAGTIAGISVGKIARCDIFGTNINLDLNSKSIKFGSLVGINSGEIRICSMPQNILLNGVVNECYVGGIACISNNNSVIDRCRKRGWIVLEELDANDCYLGGFVAIVNGLSLIDCCFSNPNGNAGINGSLKNTVKNINVGSLVASVSDSGSLDVKNCYSNVSVSIFGKMKTKIGCLSTSSLGEIICTNTLFDGRYYSEDDSALFYDCGSKNSIIQNAFKLSSLTQTGSTNIDNILSTIEFADVSLEKMNWSSDYWLLDKGMIDFFI